jgi:hypothetical protein
MRPLQNSFEHAIEVSVQWRMKTTINPQLGLLDSLMPSAPGNDFLEKLERSLDWRPIEEAL